MSLDQPVALQAPTSPFLEGSLLQFAWDSVSITAALACKRRYFYSIIMGYQPKAPAAAIALTFGIAMHKGLELYAKYRRSSDHEQSVKDVLHYMTTQSAEYAALPTDEELRARPDAEDEDELGSIDEKNSRMRTRYFLIRALVWYFEQYKDDAAPAITLPSGKAAAEFSFRVPLEHISVAGTPLVLCGHIDRVVEFNSRYYVMDHKTTKQLGSWFTEQFELSHQMTGYYIGGNAVLDRPVRGVIIDGIQLQVYGTKFGRSTISRTPGQISEYFDMLTGLIDDLEFCASKGEALAEPERAYPMNTSACMFCQFKSVCKQPPEVRQSYLALQFERKSPWNSLASR